MDLSLKGRSALVGGASQGIGYAICERLLQSGSTVVLWDIDAARLDAACRELASRGPVRGDVVELTDDAAVGFAARHVAAEHGRVDILVNNAGITGGNATTWELDPVVWRRVIEVNPCKLICSQKRILNNKSLIESIVGGTGTDDGRLLNAGV